MTLFAVIFIAASLLANARPLKAVYLTSVPGHYRHNALACWNALGPALSPCLGGLRLILAIQDALLLSEYLDLLARRALSRETCEILMACLQPSLAGVEATRPGLELPGGGRQTISLSHLNSMELNVNAICHVIGVSRRMLYRFFVQEGGVQRSIQGRRLERVRSALADPMETRRISEVTANWQPSPAIRPIWSTHDRQRCSSGQRNGPDQGSGPPSCFFSRGASWVTSMRQVKAQSEPAKALMQVNASQMLRKLGFRTECC